MTTNFWESIRESLSAKFLEIVQEFMALSRPLDADLEKDFIGLAKYLVKSRKGFDTVAPDWFKTSCDGCCKSALAAAEGLLKEWNLNDLDAMEQLILPYLAENPDACHQHRLHLIELFESGHFSPLDPCLRICSTLSLPPKDFEDVELANLQDILNQLKHCKQDDSASKLIQLETYHGCHCD